MMAKPAHLGASSSGQTELKGTIVWTGFKLASKAQCPLTCDSLGCRSADEHPCLVNKTRLERLFNHGEAVVGLVLMPCPNPTMFAFGRDEIVLKSWERHEGYMEGDLKKQKGM